MNNPDNPLLSLNMLERIFQDSYPVEKVEPVRDTTTRGMLVLRVNEDGKLLKRELQVITGAYVSGFAGDPKAVKIVYARPLMVKEKNSLLIDLAQGSIQYDPSTPVVCIGQIDYLAEQYKNLFKALGTGF
jgi:hypothetical protein